MYLEPPDRLLLADLRHMAGLTENSDSLGRIRLVNSTINLFN